MISKREAVDRETTDRREALHFIVGLDGNDSIYECHQHTKESKNYTRTVSKAISYWATVRPKRLRGLNVLELE